ncbi:glycosyl hydrolase family 28-related protein [Olivibacter sp. 47]|uniref:glycosyl hydrolase family 28-related protein n=1 Tax=Olivibacter sp. 47 TaxID=3056486 RepID=UPI0025A3EA69|nr:glycosyl hydrolase family 28-related protein [Olivibacter sp. 47]MDM8178147.1 glycosyl hydrolase family 28-related protein [Olivibacter sp. 47]
MPVFQSYNVKNHGAAGDGITDDTNAIRTLFSSVPNGCSIYFPTGTYIIDSACLLLRNKNNITIYGDGHSSVVRPSNQGVAPKKQYYHCTLAVDKCTFVHIRDLAIESKGENYGDADAAGPLNIPHGDPRADFTIQNGGSALLISRSGNVICDNLVGRRCGSVTVFYISSCDTVTFNNCYANAYSVGYAGFCADNWIEYGGDKYRRRYNFNNCSVYKESNPYAGKSGILIEGDAGNIPTVNINGGLFCDLRGNSTAHREGVAIDIADANVFIKNITGYNNDSSIRLITRGNVPDNIFHDIQNCSFYGNLVLGFDITYQGIAPGKTNLFIKNVTQYVNLQSRWATPSEWGPATDIVKYKETSALNFSFYHRNTNLIVVENFISYGSKIGVRIQDTYKVKLLNSVIHAENQSFYICGGSIEINGGEYLTNKGVVAHLQANNMTENGGTNGSNYVDFTLLNSSISSNDNSNLVNWAGPANLLRTWKAKNLAIMNGVLNNPASAASTIKDTDTILKRQFAIVKSAYYDNSPNQFAVVLKVAGLVNNPRFAYSYNQMIGPEGVRTAVHWGGNIEDSEVRLYGSDTSSLYKPSTQLIFYTGGY